MESKRKADLIPCHLIAGSLGVGKTTAIRRFIAATPDYTAVIVNDFGETGYDASFIAEAGGADKLRVENVPGGCLCCTSAAQLLPALKMICAKPEVKRIIVEPSGVALLDPLLKLLHEAAPVCGFELEPVIVFFDPSKTRPVTLELIPYWRHLADRAGIAVINRCDLASPQAVEALFQCLEAWTPAKLQVIRTSHGELPPEIFDIRGSAARPAAGHHHHAELPPAGTFRSTAVFRLDALLELLEELCPKMDRFKGVFSTDQGWVRLEIAGGQVVSKPAAGALKSSADWIGIGSEISDRLNNLAQGA
jgi:G3E family GTPase